MTSVYFSFVLTGCSVAKFMIFLIYFSFTVLSFMYFVSLKGVILCEMQYILLKAEIRLS